MTLPSIGSLLQVAERLAGAIQRVAACGAQALLWVTSQQ
jgi:hypothetical protein